MSYLIIYCIIYIIFNYIQLVESQLQVIGQYSANVLYNGKPTVINSATIQCTESNPFGSLIIGGENQVNITCIPPKYLYRYSEVGRIPQRTQLRRTRNCIVPNVNEYKNAANLAAVELGLKNPSDFEILPSSTSRKLLFFDVLGGVALGLSIANAVEIDNLQSGLAATDAKVASIKKTLTENNATLTALIDTAGALQNQTNLIRDQLSVVAKNTDILFQQDVKQQNALNAVNSTIYKITEENRKKFDAISQKFNASEQLIQAQFASSSAASSNAFALVYKNINEIVSEIQKEIDFSLQTNSLNTKAIAQLTQTVTKQVRQTDLARLTVQGFYDSVDTMEDGMKSFTLGRGIRPAKALFGVEQRILIDQLTLKYVTNTTGFGASASYRVVANQIKIYMESDYAIDNVQFVASIEDITNLFTNNNCSRPYTDFDIPPDTGSLSNSDVQQSSCFGICIKSLYFDLLLLYFVNQDPIQSVLCGLKLDNFIVHLKSFRNLNGILNKINT